MSALNDVATIARDVLNHISAGHDVSDARLAADLATLRTDLDRLLGAEPIAGLVSVESHEDAILALVRSIASHFSVPPPPAPRGVIWTAFYRGVSFQGRSPMGAAIQEGFGVDISAIATDALGEPDTAATQVLSSDNPAVVTVVDHGGGGSARADITAGATAGQTANVVDTVTDADGNSVSVPFAITVLAGDATGAAITAGAPTRTP